MFDYSSLVMAMRQKPYLYRGMNKRWALLEMLLYIQAYEIEKHFPELPAIIFTHSTA
jgi:hypothetical protein